MLFRPKKKCVSFAQHNKIIRAYIFDLQLFTLFLKF